MDEIYNKNFLMEADKKKLVELVLSLKGALDSARDVIAAYELIFKEKGN